MKRIIIVALIAIGSVGVFSAFGREIQHEVAAIAQGLAGNASTTDVTAANTSATNASTQCSNGNQGMSNFDQDAGKAGCQQ